MAFIHFFAKFERVLFGILQNKPMQARLASPDPFIPNATATQSYNRYSYCINNPLKYTDPSGFTQKPDDYEFRHGDGTSNTFNAPHFGPGYQHSLADWSNSENYFEWAHLYYSGVTETNYLEYIFSGGQYLLNGSGVVASYSNMSAQFYYDYLTGNNDYMKKNLLGLAWDAGRGNTGVGVSFTDPPKGQGGVNSEQAKFWFQFGSGTPMNVNLNTIDFSRVSMSDMKGKLIEVNLDNPFKHMTNINDALVYGTLYLYQENGNVFRAAYVNEINGHGDYYNFDVKWTNPIAWLFRNENTIVGGLINGLIPVGGSYLYMGGTPYPIFLNGTVKIKP